MDIGIITNVNASKGTVGVRVAGSRDEYLQDDDVPILKNSANITVLPKTGDRCLVSNVGGELICMGFLAPEDTDTEEANEQRGALPGDFQIGDAANGTIGNLEGGMLVMMANNAGVMITRDGRVVNLVGESVGIDTSVVHKTWGSKNGSADISESLYYALGEIINKKIDGDSGEMDINIQRMKSIKLRVNGGVTPIELGLLNRNLEEISIELETPVGQLSLSWDVLTNTFKLNVPGNISLDADGILKVSGASIGLNCEGMNILQGLINGEYQCQMTGLPLSATQQQLPTVQGG